MRMGEWGALICGCNCSTVGGLVPKGGLIRVICVEGQLDS